MNTAVTREIVKRHWAYANSRDWTAFATLLHSALHYDVPQTREYIDSADGYLDMFRTWPGDWTATIKELICEDCRAVCIIDFAVGSDTMTGISQFKLVGEKIARVTDYWPEPYEPPARQSMHMKRRM